MKIERITLYLISMRLIRPFETSFGKTFDRPCILVKVKYEDYEGWGEVVAGEGPWYSYETFETAWYILEKFAIPLVLGKEIEKPQEINKLLAPIRGHNMAKAGIEMATWDLYAKLRRRPLYQVLGGVRNKIESGVSIGIQKSINDLLKLIADYLNEGYRRIKIKIKPKWDVNIVKTIRKEYPDIPLQVDANAAYTLNDLPIFKQLDQYNLLMIEQPLSYTDLLDHSILQSQLKTPICLDESIEHLDDLKVAVKLGSCKVVNIKPGRVGGHYNSIRIHNLSQQHDIANWIGGMLETGIGRAHNVALATLPNIKYPNDISASKRYYKEDIIEPPFELNKDGTMNVPQKDGIGVEVLEDRIKKYTVKVKSFKI